MNRLTDGGDYCELAKCPDVDCGFTCWNKLMWEKLKAYEDTGAEPHEVADLKAYKSLDEFERGKLAEYVSIGTTERFRELIEKEKGA